MLNFPTVFLSAISILGLVGESIAAGARTVPRRSRLVRRQESNGPDAGKVWEQADRFEGEGLLGGFSFFNADDPTHGKVNYLDEASARSKGLARVNGGQVILSVDHTTELPPGAKRDSVRISSKAKYKDGLFIADFAAMPTGCSVWPAYWTVGPDWPKGGEIDILEGVHNQDTNQYTLHTAEGCSLDDSVKTTSKILGTKCASSGADNSGCAFKDSDNRSYGKGFNQAGGGVYAHIVDNTGIRIWHFARAEIPKDITDGKPNPASWPEPAASFASKTCEVGKFFYDHVITIDTTLCGDWAGATYGSAGCPGTCEQAVQDPKNYIDAEWIINYIVVYK
jgi:hypothetical protein